MGQMGQIGEMGQMLVMRIEKHHERNWNKLSCAMAGDLGAQTLRAHGNTIEFSMEMRS